jgi:hypothetical protein
MKAESKEFMTTEYDKISSAYFGLRDQVNEWFKAYLTLIGFPLTVLAAVLKIGEGNAATTLSSLPDFVSLLLIIVSSLGLFVTFSIISMRMEMILYARTINCVRRFFAAEDKGLVPFLVLPTTDAKPPFYESWRAMFWQVLMIGFMDGIIMGGGIMSLFKNGILVGIITGILFWFCHWFVYWLMSLKRENEWKNSIHFPEDINVSNI